MMMNEVFRLFGRIAIDSSEAEQSLDRTKNKASKLATAMNTAFTKIGRGAAVCGRAVATGLAAGAAAMSALVVNSLNLAGELEQNMGGAEKVFSFCATRMMNVGAEAYKTMGMSQSEFLATANKMGSLFQGMGFTVSESADMTANAMQRAADVASIMGLSSEEAMEAVAGMAKGNFTMMDNLGVPMNDAALAAYALDKGITKSVSSMTTAEKVALAYEYFMESTAYATGNFAAETSTLAGSLAVAKGAWQNFLSGTLTQKSMAEMVKAFVNVADVVIDNLNGLLPKLTKGLTTLIQRLTPYIPQMLQAVLPGLIAGAVALITGLAEALPGIVEALADVLPETLEQVVASLDQIYPALAAAVTSLITTLATNLPSILSSIGAAMRSWAANGFWPLIQELFRIVFGIELPSWEKVEKSISAGWTQIDATIRNWFKATFGVEMPSWEEIGKAISAWWGNVVAAVGDVFKAIFSLDFSDYDKDGVPWYTRIQNWFAAVMYALGDALLALFGLDLPPLEEIVKQISDWWEGIKNSIALSLGFSVVPTVHEAGAAHGNVAGDYASAQYNEDHPDYELTAAEYAAKYAPTDATDLNPLGSLNGAAGNTPQAQADSWEAAKKLYGIDGYATGLDFVPRDNYVARLHYGETVLNKEAAEAWRSGHANGIDYDRLAEAISQHPVAINVDSKTVGVVFAREMSKAIGNRNIQTLMGMGG